MFEVALVFDLRFSFLCCFCHLALEVQFFKLPWGSWGRSFLTLAIFPGGVAAAGYVFAVSALVSP